MSRKLIVSDGTRERELQLVGRIVVGRDPTCDITHDHSLLSRRHAEFVSAGELVVVRDLGSRNGVFVNGTKTAEHSLRPGDVVQIGPLRAQYVVDGVPLSIAPEDHDTDRTSVRRPSALDNPPAAAPARPLPASAAAPVSADEDDATRLVSARRPVNTEPERPVMAERRDAPSGLMDVDDEATRFIPAQQRSLTLGEDAPPAAVATVVSSPASLRMFVFVQVLVLGGLVIAASAFSFQVEGATARLTAFVVPLVVAIAGGYLVAGIIDRRFTRASDGRQQSLNYS